MTDSTSILVIEGEPALRGQLTLALTEVGFVVATASGYSEALQRLEGFKPEIAVIDEVLPYGEDGKNACYELHNSFHIPVILLGKVSSGEAWLRAVEDGADFYFTKPSHHQETVTRVMAILQCRKEASA